MAAEESSDDGRTIAFAIAAGQNTGDKNDSTGAFVPGAQKFARAYNCTWRTFDNTGKRDVVRKRFTDEISNNCPGGVNLFAYFGHGIPSGLPSAHLYGDDIDDLLSILSPKIAKPFFVVLYACSAGAPQGFTGKLRAKLGGDVWVYGHTNPGHSFMNANVSEEASNNSPTYRSLYGPGAELRDPWAEALKYSDLWLRFPLMEDEDIDAELNARRLAGKWEVTSSSGGRQYEFEWKPGQWSITSDQDIGTAPAGKVKSIDPKKPSSALAEGTWKVTDKLYVNWNSGRAEQWDLPLRVVGQRGRAGPEQFTAKRISRPAHLGTLQG